MPPDQLVASYPIKSESGIGPVGYRGPSNIIKGPEDYYYSVVARYDMNNSKQTSCLMRTNDLSDPTSWRFWDGSGFEGKFFNPYLDEIENPEEVLCTPLPRDNGVLAGNVTYSTYLDRYIVVDDNSHSTGYGIYFSLSEDLIHWTPKKMIVELPLAAVAGPVLSYGYGTLLDPDSESRNFETIGKTAYLYYTQFNQGHSTLDRDLIRVPIEFFPNETGNAWEFNSEGDSEGWSVCESTFAIKK